MYRLHYWFSREGRAEQIRLLLAELGQEWEEIDTEWGKPAWEALKFDTLWFGAQPALVDGDFTLVQSGVIAGYLARKHGIAPADLRAAATADAIAWAAEDVRRSVGRASEGEDQEKKRAKWLAREWRDRWLPALDRRLAVNGDTGFFVGPSLTHADTAVWDALDQAMTAVPAATLPDGRVKAFFDSIRARPRIRAYLESPRRPPA